MVNTLELTQPEGSDNDNPWRFRASGPIESASDNDDAELDGTHEVKGVVGTGTDTIEFHGVPVAFDAADPWRLAPELDLGGGPVEVIPPFLNAARVQVRSEGAHYWISHMRHGMILKAGKADAADGVLTGDNTLVHGNVANGGIDEWRIWPHAGFDIFADHDLETRFVDPVGEWHTIPGHNPDMSF